MTSGSASTFLTTAQVAALVGRTSQTVRRAVDNGQLTPATRLPGVNGAYLFTPEAVEEWRQAREAA